MAELPSSQITMDDVARHAGVSKASVSRVLNNVPGAVSEATAARILAACDALGYVPDANAASLRARQTNTIGLLLTDLGNPFFATVAAGVENTIQDAGYSLIVAGSANQHEREVKLTRVMLERRIDALLVATAAPTDDHLLAAQARGVHVALVDAYPVVSAQTLDCVMGDNRSGSRAAVQHLLDLGHRDIGVVSGRPDDSSSVERVAGIREVLDDAGIPLRPEWTVNGDFRSESGHRAGLEILSREPRPTAIFAANNLMTVGVMAAIAELGLRIPDDVSLVGFDDMDWYPLAKPAITAVAQPAYDIGARAAERLLLRLGGAPLEPETVLLPTELVVRESTAPPPKERR